MKPQGILGGHKYTKSAGEDFCSSKGNFFGEVKQP